MFFVIAEFERAAKIRKIAVYCFLISLLLHDVAEIKQQITTKWRNVWQFISNSLNLCTQINLIFPTTGKFLHQYELIVTDRED